MLCGVEVARFMFRVGKELEAQALERPGAEIIDFNGRRMGGMVWVEADACIETGIKDWISFAARFAGSLAPK